MTNANITTYTNRFNDLATLCPSFVTPEHKNLERYICGLDTTIQGLVTDSRPTTYNSAKRLAFSLTNQEIGRDTLVQQADILTYGEKKRNSGNGFKGNSNQTPSKRHETIKLYAANPTSASVAAPAPQGQYAGKHPKRNLCHLHHSGNCMN